MAQNYPDIPSTETLQNSRQKLLDRDDAVASCFAGTTFPTAGLVEGMFCYRSDEKRLYQLSDAVAITWKLVFDLAKTPLHGEEVGSAAYKDAGTAADNVPTTADADGRYVLKAGDTMTGALTALATLAARASGATGDVHVNLQDETGNARGQLSWQRSDNTVRLRLYDAIGTLLQELVLATGDVTIDGGKVWHAGNDGAGSGLDADLLDGQEGSFYRNASNLDAGTVADARLPSNAHGGRTVSTGMPAGGADGDIWYVV